MPGREVQDRTLGSALVILHPTGASDLSAWARRVPLYAAFPPSVLGLSLLPHPS
jgi:hypothetical protein